MNSDKVSRFYEYHVSGFFGDSITEQTMKWNYRVYREVDEFTTEVLVHFPDLRRCDSEHYGCPSYKTSKTKCLCDD